MLLFIVKLFIFTKIFVSLISVLAKYKAPENFKTDTTAAAVAALRFGKFYAIVPAVSVKHHSVRLHYYCRSCLCAVHYRYLTKAVLPPEWRHYHSGLHNDELQLSLQVATRFECCTTPSELKVILCLEGTSVNFLPPLASVSQQPLELPHDDEGGRTLGQMFLLAAYAKASWQPLRDKYIPDNLNPAHAAYVGYALEELFDENKDTLALSVFVPLFQASNDNHVMVLAQLVGRANKFHENQLRKLLHAIAPWTAEAIALFVLWAWYYWADGFCDMLAPTQAIYEELGSYACSCLGQLSTSSVENALRNLVSHNYNQQCDAKWKRLDINRFVDILEEFLSK